MKIAANIALLALLVGMAAALYIVILNYRRERSDYVRTPSQPISTQPERTGIAQLREIRFVDEAGTTLAGWYAPSRNGAAVVLVHGTGADRSAVLFETGFLAEAGFGVFAIDLPGQGASGGSTQWGPSERSAIRAAVSWLSQQPEIQGGRIGGLGLSMGAYVLTQAATLDLRLKALVLAASPNDVIEQNWVSSDRWGYLSQVGVHLALRMSAQTYDLKPKNVIGLIAPRALLVIGGQNDQLVPPYMAQQLFAAAGEPKELWIVPAATHVDYARAAPHEYTARVTDFFRRELL